MHRHLPDTRVETIKPKVEPKGWDQDARQHCRWGVSGKIVDHSDSHGLCYQVEHEDGTVAWYEPRELKTLERYTYTPEERAEMLARMQKCANTFYSHVTAAGCHAMIEFTGLMNEFIKVCAEAHAAGEQFPFANTHSGVTLPFQPYHLKYLAEKLNCIYGPALLASEEGRRAFIAELFGGAFELVPVDQEWRTV